MTTGEREKGTRSLETMIDVHEQTMGTLVEGRRRATRGAMLNAQRDVLELESNNRALRIEIQELERKVQGLTQLARSRLIDANALRHTINHMKEVWEKDSPHSDLRVATCGSVREHHANLVKRLERDPSTLQWVKQQIEAAIKSS